MTLCLGYRCQVVLAKCKLKVSTPLRLISAIKKKKQSRKKLVRDHSHHFLMCFIKIRSVVYDNVVADGQTGADLSSLKEIFGISEVASLSHIQSVIKPLILSFR